MPVELTVSGDIYDRNQDLVSKYEINLSRVKKMVNASTEAEATAMGLWDQFKDCFRPVSKKEVLKQIYEMIKSDQELDIDRRMEQFLNLKRCAQSDKTSEFYFRRDDGYPPDSDQPCSKFSYVVSDSAIKTENLTGHEEMQSAADIIRSHVTLSTLDEVRSGTMLGSGTYGTAYKHDMPRQQWVYKIKRPNTLRGKPHAVAPMWNDVFVKLYEGKFQNLSLAEAVTLQDGTTVLKTPFVRGEHPKDDNYRPVLAQAMEKIGYYMYDNNRNNIIMVDGLPIPIDFDLIEDDKPLA